MSKIMINSILSSDNEKEVLVSTYGIKNENLITYKDNNVFVNILLSDDSVFIKRKCDEYIFELTFKENSRSFGSYFIKNINSSLELFSKTKKLLIENNKIYINYELYINNCFSDNFVFIIEWSDL